MSILYPVYSPYHKLCLVSQCGITVIKYMSCPSVTFPASCLFTLSTRSECTYSTLLLSLLIHTLIIVDCVVGVINDHFNWPIKNEYTSLSVLHLLIYSSLSTRNRLACPSMFQSTSVLTFKRFCHFSFFDQFVKACPFTHFLIQLSQG